MSARTIPCDKCDEPINLDEDMRYTIADKFDDDDNLVSGRHGKCQPTSEQLKANFDRAFDGAMSAIDKLRKMGL